MNRLKQFLFDPTPEDYTTLTILLIGLALINAGLWFMGMPS